MEAQAAAAHHRLPATVDGLLHQLWKHCHRGAQAFQTTARAPPGPRQGNLIDNENDYYFISIINSIIVFH